MNQRCRLGGKDPSTRKRKLFPLLILLFLLFGTGAFAQPTYSLTFSKAPYNEVLKQISDKTAIRFIYSNSDIAQLQPLTLTVTAGSIAELLDKVLAGTGITYVLDEADKTVVLSKDKQLPTAKRATPTAIAAEQEKITLKGNIKDANTSEPLAFVSVYLQGTSYGATTDLSGNFSIQVPLGAKTLSVSFLGYKMQEVAIGNAGSFVILLQPDLLKLDETVVVGYQTRKKSSLTGSVKALDASFIESKPVANFDQALQGRVAGMVIQTTGNPGSTSSVKIRGQASISSGTDPLYILDGTPITPDAFAAINPNDIENFSVLKDASAASIYGASSSNGVVLITTKKGRNMERTEVRYMLQTGAARFAKPKFTMMNTAQRLQYEEDTELRKLDHTGKYYIVEGTDYRESKDSLMAINTSWRDEVFRTGLIQSHELSMRGGNEKTRHFASLNYFNQEGTIKDTDFRRLSLRLNLTHNVSSKVEVGINSTLGHTTRNDLPTGQSYAYNVINPVFASYAIVPYQKPYDADGNLIDFQQGLFRNPLLYMDMSQHSTEDVSSVVNVYAEWKPSSKLKFKTNVGVDYGNSNGLSYTSPYWDADITGYVARNFSQSKRLINNNLLTYTGKLGEDHSVNVLVGQETIMFDAVGFNNGGSKLPDDNIRMLVTAAIPDGLDNADFENEYAFISYFTQVNYGYKDKYLLDFSFRRDGSSKFAINKKWGNFWSVGAAWQLKKEDFLIDNQTITSLKLIASTGTSGNSNIGNYSWFQSYGYGPTYNDSPGMLANNPGNNSLKWEAMHKSNVGIELGIRNRYQFKLEAYYNKTIDMLMMTPISLTSGFTDMQKNVGKISNKGVEFEWELFLIQAKDFTWSFNGNISFNRTMVLELTGENDELSNSFLSVKEGMRYGLFNMVRYAGVDPLSGEPLWYDVNGKLTKTYAEGNRVLHDKSYIPEFTGGFGTDITYKSLTLSALFFWMGERYTISQAAAFYNSNGRYKSYNQSTDMLNYWKQPGDITSIPHFVHNANQYDDRYLENASFLRLRNISLSYNLDQDYLKRLGIAKAVRVYVQAQNLLTITPYKGFDPEVVGMTDGNNYPNPRIFTFGLDVTF